MVKISILLQNKFFAVRERILFIRKKIVFLKRKEKHVVGGKR